MDMEEINKHAKELEALHKLYNLEDTLEFLGKLNILPIDDTEKVKQYIRYVKIKGRDIDPGIVNRLKGRFGPPGT